MLREILKTQISNAWGVFDLSARQIAKVAAVPLRVALTPAPGSVKSAVSTVEQQIGSAFHTTVRAGESFQRRAVDLFTDVVTLKPLSGVLVDRGLIPGTRLPGRQGQPELDYLKTIHDAGPPGTSLVTIVLATLYSSLNRHGEGIRQFQIYLDAHKNQLTPKQRAIYLSCLALLRAASAQVAPAWELPVTLENVRLLLGELDEARSLTDREPDFDPNFYKLLPRWVSGLLLANLPWPFGDKKAAIHYLTWCEQIVTATPENKELGFQFLRETYFNLAVLYRDSNDKRAPRYLALSGFPDYDRPPIQIATVFSITSDGTRDGIKQVKESVPGKVFTVSGFDLSEYNYFITSDGSELIAVDAGSRADTCLGAYQFFAQYYARKYPHSLLPRLTKVFMTHFHWDHSGGHSVYSDLNPHVEFYSRSNYMEEAERARNQPPPFKWIMGEKFKIDAIRSYTPTSIISEDTTLEIGGTTVRLILLPGGGGETPDGMFVFLPEYEVLYAGDFMVPWVGSPYVCEGDSEALLETLTRVATLEPRPRYVLHGHWAVTLFYPTVEILLKMRPHLSWLKERALEEIYSGDKTRAQILAMNLIPPAILHVSEADVQFPFLAMREVFIERLYRQKIGYWGPRLENVDHLSEEEIGNGLGRYMQLSEDDFAAGIERMLKAGDFELAGRVVAWALAHYPNSRSLKEARQSTFLQLIQKYQMLNVFKFAMYSEHIGVGTPQME